MSFPKTGESPVTDAAVIRTVLPRHTVKRLAQLMGISPETAKHWLYYGPARSRLGELNAALARELDRQDAEERARARLRLSRSAA